MFTSENSVRYREERAAYEKSLLPPPVDPEVARREKLAANADRASRLHTDESRLYPVTGEEFAAHETVYVPACRETN